MHGMVFKEFLYLKRLRRNDWIVLAIAAVTYFTDLVPKWRGAETWGCNISALIVALTSAFWMNSLTCEAKTGWDRFARSLPVSPAVSVGVRYGLVALSSLAGALLSVGSALIAGGGHAEPEMLLRLCALSIAFPLILISIILPIYYRFGLLTATIVFGVLGIPMLFFMVLFRTVWAPGTALFLTPRLLLLASLVITPCSFAISSRIYARKEF